MSHKLCGTVRYRYVKLLGTEISTITSTTENGKFVDPYSNTTYVQSISRLNFSTIVLKLK